MKISYYDLLNAIRKGSAPERILIYGHEYTWDGADYEWKGRRLADALREWTPLAQTKVDFIEVDEKIAVTGTGSESLTGMRITDWHMTNGSAQNAEKVMKQTTRHSNTVRTVGRRWMR